MSRRPLARRLGALALLSALAAAAAAGAASFPAAYGGGGAVASPEPTSTAAGLEALRLGGNAVDAAVATALAMAVVHPQAGNLGGGGFALVRTATASGDRVTSLDFRETAPAAARRDTYLEAERRGIADASLVGPLAAGVPGSIAGLRELHRRHGKLAWERVVEPARRAAADGFRVSRRLHQDLVEERELLQRFPETAAVWLPGGEPPAAGSVQRLPGLAATLAAYARGGPEALTGGAAAAAVEAASRRHGGLLTAADLAAYRPVWREPVRFRAFGWELAGMDLPSSGGIITAQTLALLERLGWAELPRFGAERAHLLAEVWRRAFADRQLLGDPATSRALAADLLAEEWLAALAAGIARRRAADSAELLPWPGAEREAAETNHLSAIDGDGNAVALTTTLNGTFGCGLWVPEVGFLNNEMDDFSTVPGRPNDYGLIQGEANEVGPGKRMLSSMSPTLAWKGGELVALGGRGGSRIPTAVSQVLLNLIVDGDPLQAAVDRPRIHHQWLPDRISAEPDALAPEVVAALEALGHRVETRPTGAGKVHAARRLADGRFEAAGDPRGPAHGGVVEPLP